MTEWLQTYEPVLWWLFAGSILTFFASLIVVPMLLVRIPPDYFTHERRNRMPWDHQHLVIRALLIVIKNAFGAILLVMGLIMLFTPGQGLITVLVGLLLLNYPGKYRLEKWIVSRPSIFRSINWLRKRAGRQPLVLD